MWVLVLALAACRDRPLAPVLQRGASSLLIAPDGSLLPSGAMAVSIRRGYALLTATRDSLPDHVGSKLRCTSCHLDGGRKPGALTLTGVYARFPQYRSRVDAVQRIEDRINDCFLRSLNGTSLANESTEMRDIVAYLAFISRGVAVGDSATPAPAGPAQGDTVAGATIYRAQCARCHSADGSGMASIPPLWGASSFNIGAGMARVRTAASFIRQNMPFDRPGSLNPTDALNVAAYITSRSRPDFAGKENDWPRGDAPADAPYKTTAGKTPPR